MFADDSSMHIHGDSATEINSILEDDLECLNDRCNTNLMCINFKFVLQRRPNL